LREEGVFDLRDIPELQQSEDEQSKRDIAEIYAGLKTVNDVLKERGKEPKPWGDKKTCSAFCSFLAVVGERSVRQKLKFLNRFNRENP
jgi:hypothetical protein